MENFASTLDHHTALRPRKVVVTCDGATATNEELLRRVNALACGLAEIGVGRGDVVALLLFNSIEFIELVYAVNRLGAIFLPINVRLAPAEWQYILVNSDAKVLVADATFGAAVDSVRGGLPALKHTVFIGESDGTGRAYETLIGPHLGRTRAPLDVGGDAIQRLMYTSGTTSRPKGVCISHANVAWKNLGLIVQFGFTDQDVAAIAGPLYHVGALDMGGLAILHAGGSIVIQRRFEPAELVTLIARHRATAVWLAPSMVNALLQETSFRDADLSTLRVILSGGEKMPESRLLEILEVLPDLWFADAYGLTETVSSDTFLPKESMFAKLGSVGLPILHQELRIADESGLSLPPDTVGEVLVRGPKVFSGYWRDPAATEAAFIDGWFRTGDLGRLDSDGFLFIEDRKKDMIVSGGENIASPEVERALYEHPAIVEAAVIGHPDARWGEVPHAFIVLREGNRVTDADVIEFCRERLARFKVPRYVSFVDALPRTASGKVIKRELRTSLEGPS